MAGGKLTLAEGASAYAKQTVALDAMSGVRSATVSGTVRAKGTKATDAGGVNKLTVTAKVYSKANELMKTLTEDIVTTSRAKNYPVGPWVLNYDNVGSVEFVEAPAVPNRPVAIEIEAVVNTDVDAVLFVLDGEVERLIPIEATGKVLVASCQ